jgi:hypothetical protein
MAVAAPAAAAAAGAAAGGSGAAGGAAAGSAGSGAAGGGAATGGAGGGAGAQAGKAGSGLKPGQVPRGAGQGDGEDEQRERRNRQIRLIAGPIVFCLFIILFFCAVLLSVFGASRSQAESGLIESYPTGSGIPLAYWPMYVSAANHYKVNPYLLASIHYQETRFSTAESSHSGVNSNGCCAGPMQFNVKAGSWKEYEAAFRPIAKERDIGPFVAERKLLTSCDEVPPDEGCVYDNFDAIAAAAKLLNENHGDTSLASAGTRLAVCAYIGSCSEVDSCTGSENEYCEVLPRARSWELEGIPTASGPVREKIVQVAVGELEKGVHEGTGNCNPYGPCDSWCAMFTTWVWEHAGVHIRVAMSHEGLNPYWVGDLEKYAKNNDLWSSTPAPGDMIVWGEAHVGLVRSVSGGQIAEIGGNQSDAVTELNGSPDGLGEGTPNGYVSPPEGGQK